MVRTRQKTTILEEKVQTRTSARIAKAAKTSASSSSETNLNGKFKKSIKNKAQILRNETSSKDKVISKTATKKQRNLVESTLTKVYANIATEANIVDPPSSNQQKLMRKSRRLARLNAKNQQFENEIPNSKKNSEYIEFNFRKCVVKIKRCCLPGLNPVNLKKSISNNSLESRKEHKQLDVSATEEQTDRRRITLNIKNSAKSIKDISVSEQTGKRLDDPNAVSLSNQQSEVDKKISENGKLSIRKCIVRIKRCSLPKLRPVNLNVNDCRNSLVEITKAQNEQELSHSSEPVNEAQELTSRINGTENLTQSDAKGIVFPRSKHINFEITSFEPMRNSTVFDLEQVVQSSNHIENDKTQVPSSSSRRKFIKNPNEIKKILLGEDQLSDCEIDDISSDEESMPVTDVIDKRKTKFLDRMKQPKAGNQFTKDTSNIYEFPSSQSSDFTPSNEDPAADIIEKLIKENKVKLGATRKGRVKVATNKKVRTRIGKKRPGKKNQGKSQRKEQKEQQLPLKSANIVQTNNNAQENNFVKLKNKNKTTFSNLAKSVLMHEAKKYPNTNQEVNKLMSTPLNRKVPTLPHPTLSPILSTIQSQPQSPWRVDGNVTARTLNRSSFNIRSTEPDVPIPTSTEHVSNITNGTNQLLPIDLSMSSRTVLSPDKTIPIISEDDAFMPMENDSLSNEQHLVEPSIKSSFSSNDSDAENICPIMSNNPEDNDKNRNIFNRREFPNPLQSLPIVQRKPLQPINIIEVVALPSLYKPNNKTNNNENNKADDQRNNSSSTNLFGFEGYLDHGELENTEENSGNETEAEQILHERLKKLRQWLPTENTKPSNGIKGVQLFDEGIEKQRNIKEMLCSTMINQGKTTIQQPSDNLDNQKRDEEQNKNFNKNKSDIDNEVSDLFEDLEPSINYEGLQRTYIKPKKKRKRRNNFLLFFDSDDYSDDGSNDEEHEDKKSPKKYVKKRSKKETEEKAELNSFVKEFNDMCKEVESFNVIIE